MPPEPRVAMAQADPRRLLLRAGLAELALSASDETVSKLLAYLDLLEKWNRAYNLSALREPAQMVRQHLLDCLTALPAIDRHLDGRPARILDVGSGAGLPGVVFAVMRARWQVCCIDAVAKKASFVRQVAVELGVGNLQSEHARVEQLQLPAFDIVVSRAFASLREFTRLTQRHLLPGGCWVAMKARSAQDEIGDLDANIDVFHVEPLQVPGLAAQRCLVWMRPR